MGQTVTNRVPCAHVSAFETRILAPPQNRNVIELLKQSGGVSLEIGILSFLVTAVVPNATILKFVLRTRSPSKSPAARRLAM